MKKRMGTILVLFAVFLSSCFLFASLVFAQEMPKIGEVIDKNNYKKYAHLFPEEFLVGFENGWDGYVSKPDMIKVRFGGTKDYPIPKKFADLSEKNRGKYTINKDGLIEGEYNFAGLPFPDATPNDKDFAQKLMWNHQYVYLCENMVIPLFDNYGKRKREPPTIMHLFLYQLAYGNRLYFDPKPVEKNPEGYYLAHITLFTEPTSIKNMMTIFYDYFDPLKSGETYTYIPTLRRAIRGESGIRSVPQQGTIWSIDDQAGFGGRVYEFTYKYLGERKVLAMTDAKYTKEDLRKGSGGDLPWPDYTWSLVDCYVIEIHAKDPGYPQSKKIIYVNKLNYSVPYCFMWDRAGKFWKLIVGGNGPQALPDGDMVTDRVSDYGIDVQMGFGAFSIFKMGFDKNLKHEDFMISNVMKRAIR